MLRELRKLVATSFDFAQRQDHPLSAKDMVRYGWRLRNVTAKI